MRNLSAVSINNLTNVTAIGSTKTYRIADNVQVYIHSSVNNSYELTLLSAVDTDTYTLTGYYETILPAEGQIRIIVAVKK